MIDFLNPFFGDLLNTEDFVEYENNLYKSGRSTKHWSFGMRHAFLNVMKNRKMPEYCTERFTRASGSKGVKVMSNEFIRGVETWIGQNQARRQFANKETIVAAIISV